MSAQLLGHRDQGHDHQDGLFEKVASDILEKGYSINPGLMPPTLSEELASHVRYMSDQQFNPAGVGRSQDYQLNQFVRSDSICWISGDSEAGRNWLDWSGQLQNYLNRRLYLGLFSFESHFAHYQPGDFYKRHLDAFKGQANRVLSLVAYLNPGWMPDEGGELVLYTDQQDQQGIRVTPGLGTFVVFLSEEFPHEVLPASRDRFSIAGWFRLNSSTFGQLDPER